MPEVEVGKLTVQYRNEFGKGPNRRLRTGGQIPAVLYGGGGEPLHLAVSASELLKSLDPIKKSNTLIALTVNGAPGGAQNLTVMLRDSQRDTLRGDLSHADFIRVSIDKPVHATVPLVLTGKPEGVKLGGILHAAVRHLQVACTPDKIPAKIEVDVSALGMNAALHVRDLQLPEGVRALLGPDETVCSVTAQRADKTEAAAATTDAAAAAPAAGAKDAKAAPAKDAKGGAAPAKDAKAAAPAKDAKKK